MKNPMELVKIVEDKIKRSGKPYRMIEHAPEGNCEKVSQLRGNHIHEAAKALLIGVRLHNKTSKYVLAVLPGDRGVNFEAVAKQYSARTANMAQQNKIVELLDCEAGRVPPFSFNQDVAVFIDNELVEDNKNIYFSPGSLDRSIEMTAKDYREMIKEEGGLIFGFSKILGTQIVSKNSPSQAAATSAERKEEEVTPTSIPTSIEL